MSLNPALFQPVLAQKAQPKADSYQEEREDIAAPAISPYVSGQCPLDSPRDKFLFSLFKSGWINREKQCNPQKTWPKLLPFGREEHTYLKTSCQRMRFITCKLQDGTTFSGSFNLAELFTRLRLFQVKQNNFVPPTIHFIGSELHELEHKFGWSLKNLSQLTGIEIPEELVETIEKRTSNDSDWRYYPEGHVSPELYSLEILNYFADCIFRDTRNQENPPNWEEILRAVHQNGLLKFHLYDAEKEPVPEIEPNTCYATVGFSDPYSKPVDILLVKELSEECLFSFDDCHLRATTLMMDFQNELETGMAIDTTKNNDLHPESQLHGAIGVWQHLIHQLSYSISSHHTEAHTSKAYLRYISHRIQGGRSSHSTARKLFEKIHLDQLPDEIEKYHKKHGRDLHFKHNFAVTTLFSLVELNCSHEDLMKFWKKISSPLEEHNPSLCGLIVQALKQTDITPKLIYKLLHLLSFINLGAPDASKNSFYLHFQEEKAVFEIIETNTWSTQGDVSEAIEELKTELNHVSPKSLNSLKKLIDHLLPPHSANPDQETVLRFYKDSLKLNYSQIEECAQDWLHAKHPALQLLGVHLSFIVSANIARVIPLKEWISYSVKHPHLRQLVSFSLFPVLDRTPRQNLKKAIESFAHESSDWIKTLVAVSDRDTIQEVSEIVMEAESSPEEKVLLFEKIVSHDTLKAWYYFVKIESSIKEEDWLQSIKSISDGLQTTNDAALIRNVLDLILDKKISTQYPLHSTFISLASRLADIEGPSAAEVFLFQAIEKEIVAPHMEQTASICSRIFDDHLQKDIPKALDFWEKSERKSIWKLLPSTEKNRQILALAQEANNFSLIRKLDQTKLSERDIAAVHKKVMEEIGAQIDRVNFKRAQEISKEFAKILTAQDAHRLFIQKGRKCLETQQWQQAADILKELLKYPETDTARFVEDLLNAFFENKVASFADLLLSPEIHSLLGKTPFLKRLALQYLQDSRSKNHASRILVFLLKNLNVPEEQEVIDLLERINPILEQTSETLAADLTAQLTEKKAFLISSSPALTVRFLTALNCRKIPITFPKKVAPKIYSQMLQFLQESKECNKIHLLLTTLKDQLLFSGQVLMLITELASQLLDRKDLQKAEMWMPHVASETLLIKGLRIFLENIHMAPISSLFERLKNTSHLRHEIHSIIKLLSEQPHSSPLQIFDLLMDFSYPVSPLWPQTLCKLRTSKQHEPRFLKTLQADPQFLETFAEEPSILHECLLFAIEALCKHTAQEPSPLCKQIAFCLSLTPPTAPKERVAVIEAAMKGLLIFFRAHPDSKETADFLWSLAEQREKILEWNAKEFPPQPPGLGWKKTIGAALVRCGNTEIIPKLVQEAISRIELGQLTPECIKDVEKLTILALKKEEGGPFLNLLATYPRSFLSQINLKSLFKTLLSQKIYDYLDTGFQLIHQVLTTVDEESLGRDTESVILDYAARWTDPETPKIEAYSTLVHEKFNRLTRFKAGLFNQLFTVQAVQIAQLKDHESVPKTLSCLLLHLNELSRFPVGQDQCMENAFSLLLHYLGWSRNYKLFSDYYVALLETGCALSRASPSPSLANQEKLFGYVKTMISIAFKFTYSSQPINDFLLEFIWNQINCLCVSFPDKQDEIIPLMENALYSPLIGQEFLPICGQRLKECATICDEKLQKHSQGRTMLRFSLYNNLYIELGAISKHGTDVVATELLFVIKKLIETKNPYQTSLTILLLKNFHGIIVGMPFLENHPAQMVPIYEALMEAAERHPFFQMLSFITQENACPEASVGRSFFYNFTLMLSQNKYLSHANWKPFKISILFKWMATLEKLCQRHANLPEEKAIYRAMLTFLTITHRNGYFQHYALEYTQLVDQAVERYFKIMKSISPKDPQFEKMIDDLSPSALFKLDSTKEEPLLKKSFSAFITKLLSLKKMIKKH